jgi:photoactive yellow protein
MTQLAHYAFAQPELLPILTSASQELLDSQDVGLIGFDADGMVCQYNAFESRAAGLSPQRVLGQALFTHVAPCMNNFLVAQRFEDAASTGSTLDETIDYVLTLRMRPVKVRLRLLSAPAQSMRYVLIQRAL